MLRSRLKVDKCVVDCAVHRDTVLYKLRQNKYLVKIIKPFKKIIYSVYYMDSKKQKHDEQIDAYYKSFGKAIIKQNEFKPIEEKETQIRFNKRQFHQLDDIDVNKKEIKIDIDKNFSFDLKYY